MIRQKVHLLLIIDVISDIPRFLLLSRIVLLRFSQPFVCLLRERLTVTIDNSVITVTISDLWGHDIFQNRTKTTTTADSNRCHVVGQTYS